MVEWLNRIHVFTLYGVTNRVPEVTKGVTDTNTFDDGGGSRPKSNRQRGRMQAESADSPTSTRQRSDDAVRARRVRKSGPPAGEVSAVRVSIEQMALWQNLWVKMALSGSRQASPLRVATGGDASWRLEARRRRSPACCRKAGSPQAATGDRSPKGETAV